MNSGPLLGAARQVHRSRKEHKLSLQARRDQVHFHNTHSLQNLTAIEHLGDPDIYDETVS